MHQQQWQQGYMQQQRIPLITGDNQQQTPLLQASDVPAV
jgi:hypothetical protein